MLQDLTDCPRLFTGDSVIIMMLYVGVFYVTYVSYMWVIRVTGLNRLSTAVYRGQCNNNDVICGCVLCNICELVSYMWIMRVTGPNRLSTAVYRHQ